VNLPKNPLTQVDPGVTRESTRYFSGEQPSQNSPKETFPESFPSKATSAFPARKASTSQGPTNPYKEGTKKFLIAERLIAGEKDRDKIMRQLGVSQQTIYGVSSDLRKHGYTISIDSAEAISNHPPTFRGNKYSSQVSQNDDSGNSSGKVIRESTSQKGRLGKLKKYQSTFLGKHLLLQKACWKGLGKLLMEPS